LWVEQTENSDDTDVNRLLSGMTDRILLVFRPTTNYTTVRISHIHVDSHRKPQVVQHASTDC